MLESSRSLCVMTLLITNEEELLSSPLYAAVSPFIRHILAHEPILVATGWIPLIWSN